MTNKLASTICVDEVDFIARAIIAQHGSAAALAATNLLNEMIDQRNWYKRETWAAVVCAIHAYQPPGAAALAA
jgi:hypothetical protein